VKALVQMFTNGGGAYFAAATEADSGGMFWFFLWGDVAGQEHAPYKSAWNCDEAFLLWSADPLTGWRHDGAPVVTFIPDNTNGEGTTVWEQHVLKVMEKQVMTRPAPVSCHPSAW